MNKRFYSLDALKFGAAIIIVFHHFQQMNQVVFSSLNFYFGKIYFGYVVELFFLISGFFMGMKVDKNKDISFGKFILHKILQLYPMAIFASLLFLLFAGIFFILTGETYDGNVFSLWKILIGFLQIFSGSIMDNYVVPNSVTWYICVLMLCYVIYWLILWLSNRMKVTPFFFFIVMILMGIAICVCGGFDFPFLYISSGRGYESFFWGIVLFYIWERLPKKGLLLISIVTFLICIFTYIVNFKGFWASYSQMLVFVFYPSIIILLLESKIFLFVFEHKIFGLLGKVSYEVYLLHYPLIILGTVITKILGITPNYNRYDMFAFALIVCVIASTIYYFIERPITKYLVNHEEKIFYYLTHKK